MNGAEVKRDIAFGLVSFCFTIFFLVSIHFTVAKGGGMGVSGRVFPYIIGGLLTFLSSALVISRCWALLRMSQELRSYAALLSREEWTRISCFILSLGVYILAFMYIGYIVATTAYTLFLLRFMGAENKRVVWFMTIVTPLALWAFFTQLLGMQFPEALLI